MSTKYEGRTKAYLRGVIELVRLLLPGEPNQGAIASRLGDRKSAPQWLSNVLGSGGKPINSARIEQVQKALLDMCRETLEEARRREDRDAVSRCEEAEAILVEGIEHSAQTVARLLVPSRGDGANAKTPVEKESRIRVRVAWGKLGVVDHPKHLSSKEMIEIGRAVWPAMPPRQVGFIYQEVGDMLRRDGKDGPSLRRAAWFCEQAEAGQAKALVDTFLSRAKCYAKICRSPGVSDEERDSARSEAHRMFERADLLGSIYPFPPLLRAELSKSHGEFIRLETTPVGDLPSSLPRDARHLYERAANLYKLARLERDEPRSSLRPGSMSAASMSHNTGYCLFRAGNVEARDWFLKAAQTYARRERPGEVAYNLKYLALFHANEGDLLRAVWCSQASMALYVASGLPPSAEDRKDLARHADRIAASAPTETMRPPPATADEESASSYAARLLAAYADT